MEEREQRLRKSETLRIKEVERLKKELAKVGDTKKGVRIILFSCLRGVLIDRAGYTPSPVLYHWDSELFKQLPCRDRFDLVTWDVVDVAAVTQYRFPMKDAS